MKLSAIFLAAYAGAMVLPAAPDAQLRRLISSASRRSETAQHYLTSSVTSTELVRSVSATGSVSAVQNVEVGSQLSGQVAHLMVDFNDVVTKGQTLAQLDESTYVAAVEAAQAALESARADEQISAARLQRARVDAKQTVLQKDVLAIRLDTARISFDIAEREMKRKAFLGERGAAASADIQDSASRREAAQAAVKEAAANLAAQANLIEGTQADVTRAMAELEGARASVRKLESQSRSARVDLERTRIRAPIDGVVIGRVVEQGQVLASTLETRTLFTLAGDLRQMEVHAKVDESEIAKIALGQSATFTVDSFPGREFKASVRQIRKASQLVQNVVTYTVVLSVANPDYALLPGMTAIVKIVFERETPPLSVPMSALTFKPRTEPAAYTPSARGAHIWVLRNGVPEPVAVEIGDDNGDRVTIKSTELHSGDSVITGEVAASRTGPT